MDFDELCFKERYSQEPGVFDCGDNSLNDFYVKREYNLYEKERLGHTTFVFIRDVFVAYYTLSAYSLRIDYLPETSQNPMTRIESYPAILIGRLAVDGKHQNECIGRVLVQRIIARAIEENKKIGIRLILVQARSDAVRFYSYLGFEAVRLTRREKDLFRRKGARTMYLDLKKVVD